jgi:hypothetical protein
MYLATSSSWRRRGIGRSQPRAACMARMMFSRTVSSPTNPSVRRFSEQNAMSWPIAAPGCAARRLAVDVTCP